MAKKRLACCYFPTKVLFVEDGEIYLKTLLADLNNAPSFQFCSDPKLAFKRIETTPNTRPFLEKWVSRLIDAGVDLEQDSSEEETSHAYIDIKVDHISDEVSSPERFNDISVMVVDYSNPNLDALDFCRQLKHSAVKKLMLIDEDNQEIALTALSEGVIDEFIQKKSPDFLNKFQKSICRLQQYYFKDLSRCIIQCLSANPNSCLSDPIFIDFFKVMRKEHGIVEYYLVNESGSFLLLDVDGNPSWLLVKSESDMELTADVAQGNYAPDVVQSSLKKREKLLFLLTKHDDWSVPIEEWKNYMHLATKLIGENNSYYCAFVNGPAEYDIHPENIASYQAYLDSAQ